MYPFVGTIVGEFAEGKKTRFEVETQLGHLTMHVDEHGYVTSRHAVVKPRLGEMWCIDLPLPYDESFNPLLLGYVLGVRNVPNGKVYRVRHLLGILTITVKYDMIAGTAMGVREGPNDQVFLDYNV